MSDVSGIPYMGTMGMGNFFAPPFGGGGMNMSAGQISSTYMPEIANNQNVLGNLYGGGQNAGFGQLTNYYSQLAANQLSGIGSTNPYGVFSDTGRAANAPAFDQSAMQNFMTGGGGYNFPSIPDYSGGLGGGGGGAINWDTIFQSAGGGLGGSPNFNTNDMQAWAGNWNAPQSSAFDFSGGAGMFGGLAGGMGGAYQGQNNPIDWTQLSQPQQQQPALTDPYPNMAMPGGLNAPMTGMDAPMEGAPSSTMDWSTLFGSDSSQPYTSGIAPDASGGQSFGERFDALGGSAPMGDNAPQQPQPLPETSHMSDALLGYTPQQWTDNAYDKPSDPLMDRPLPGNPYTDPQGGGLSATDLSEQARAKLAEIMSGDRKLELKIDPQDKVAAEPRPDELATPADYPPAEPYTGIPQASAATSPATDVYPGDNPPRPPANIPQGTNLRDSPTLKGVNTRLVAAVAGGSTFLPPGYTVQAVSGVRPGKEQAHHRTGNAADFQIFDPNGKAIPHKGEDTTGMYTKLAQGTKAWVQQNDPELMKTMRYGGAFGTQRGGGGVPDLMHYDLGLRPDRSNYGNMRPEVGFGVLQPMSAEEQRASLGSMIQSGITAEGRAYADQNAPLSERPAAATVEERPGVNQGQTVSSPPAEIPPPAAPAAPAAPVKHSGLELARANIDTPIEKIAMERGGQKAVDQISFMAMGKTPRQLSQQYGGMFMDRAEPLFKSLGITRQDFDKAATMPPTKQDIKMRFAEMEGGFGPYPDYTGPEAAPGSSGGVFGDFRQSTNVEDRRGELANLMPREFGYGDLPEVAPNSMTAEAGLGNLPMPEFTGSGALPTAAEQEGMDAMERLQTNIKAREEGRQPELFPERRPDQSKTVPTDETGDLPDLPMSPGPRSDLGTSDVTDFSAQSRSAALDRGMDPSYWADVFGGDAGPPEADNFDWTDTGQLYGFPSAPEAAPAPPTRDDLAAAVSAPNNGFSRYSDEGYGTSTGRAPPVTLSPEHMRTMAQIESTQNPNDVTGSYKGLYNLSDREFRKYGGRGSIFNPEENTKAASAKMYAEGQRAQDILGRVLTPVEQYMVHQQGLGGFLAHTRNPDQPAWQSMRNTVEGRQKGDAWAKSAIWGNLSDAQKDQFGSVNNITSRDFIDLWNTKYYQKMVESGLSPGGLSDLP